MQSVQRVHSFQFSPYQILLTTLFLATNFTYFTMAPRILLIFGFPQPGGILVFPFTFLLSDVLTENYTYSYARFLIWCVLLTLGFFTLSTWISMHVPAQLDYGYATVFNHYPRLYFSIALATFAAFFVNNTIVSKFKIKWEGKFFWLRSIMASAVGHIIFSIIWVVTYHAGEVDMAYLWKMIACMYIWKMSFEICGTPFANMLSKYIKKKEGFDPYDRDTNYNPFLL
ncbi:MAG: queuosine precursor transporter [Gammaproteobacteria bacterium]